jgi:hypothetical protein
MTLKSRVPSQRSIPVPLCSKPRAGSVMDPIPTAAEPKGDEWLCTFRMIDSRVCKKTRKCLLIDL